MVKCPYCQFDNEDGALFCEQCKSDLGGVMAAEAPMAAVAVEAAPAEAMAVEAMPMEAAPVEAFAEATPLEAAPIEAAAVEAAPVMAEPAPVVAPPAPAPAPPVAATGGALPAGAQPKLVVIRGQKINAEYPIYEGLNFIGRADEKPVDIDLEDQEPPDRIWSSRQHAFITFENGTLTVEDLNSSNGTFVNRARIYPGQKQPLNVNDVIQIGTVQMKVKTS